MTSPAPKRLYRQSSGNFAGVHYAPQPPDSERRRAKSLKGADHWSIRPGYAGNRDRARMKKLDPPDSHYLNAAEGWLKLGDHLEANEELEPIAPENRAHPDVLQLRWQIYARENRWQACLDIATALTKKGR
jgi:hypothetical protein